MMTVNFVYNLLQNLLKIVLNLFYFTFFFVDHMLCIYYDDSEEFC